VALSQDPLQRFFESEFRLHPVTATFSGIHGHDHLLPDWSPEGLDNAIGEMTSLRSGLSKAQAPAPASAREVFEATHYPDQVDVRLADGHLDIQIAEMRSPHFQRSNPALYTGEAVFGAIALLTRSVAPFEVRLEAVTARLRAIPPFLRLGRRTLQAAAIPAAWTSRALRECEGAAILLSSGLDAWLAHESTAADSVGPEEGYDQAARQAARDATAAFDEFATWLVRESTEASPSRYGCGPDLFDLMLGSGHCCRATRADLLDAARHQFEEQAAHFTEAARREAAGGWPEIQQRLAADHPDAGSFLRAHAEVWQACRDTSVAANLVTWPDAAPVRFVPLPAWIREAAPHLYYLLYRSPPPFDLPAVHRCTIPAIDSAMPAEARDQRLRVSNASVIKLNHVVHHGSLGHHVQNWYAARAASRVGRYAATDGASRIAMLCGGTMAEGWACYATDLMAETGFLTRLELVAEEHSRLRQLARAIVDIELHQGTMSFEAAVAFYAGQVGMAEGAARAEVCKNSMFPGGAIMYWLGTSGIHGLRADLRRAIGPRFSPRRFHDRLLSYGAIPVPLVAELMARDELAST
jgi:hypothetical protein